MGQVGDAKLLVMASLLVADELSDAYAELDRLQGTGRAGAAAQRAEAEEKLADAIHALATRIESIAETVEQA